MDVHGFPEDNIDLLMDDGLTHANLVYQIAYFSRKYRTLWMLIYEFCVE